MGANIALFFYIKVMFSKLLLYGQALFYFLCIDCINKAKGGKRLNTLKLKYRGSICRLLEWLGKDETTTYQHHLKMFAKEVLKTEGTS